MAVEVGISPSNSPWAWGGESFNLEPQAPVSPTIRGATLDDMGSFLPARTTFRLSGEELPMLPPAVPSGGGEPSSRPRSISEPAPSSAPQAAPPLGFGLPQSILGGGAPPGGGANSSYLEQAVANVFDEIYRDDAPAAHATLVADPHGHPPPALVAPSAEEQAWLDQEFDSAMEACGEDANSRSGSWWSPEGGDVTTSREDEEHYVKAMLQEHPALDEDEARWLFQRERASATATDMEAG